MNRRNGRKPVRSRPRYLSADEAFREQEQEMFGTIKISLGREAIYGTLSVNTDAFPDAVQRHIYEYGLRQILNDAMAQKKDKDGFDLSREEIRAKADARLANLLAGVLRTTSDRPVVDPKTQIVFNELRQQLLTKWRVEGIFGNFPKGTKNRFLFTANSVRAKAGKSVFENDEEFLATVLAENPKTAAKLAARADEILREREEDLGIDI